MRSDNAIPTRLCCIQTERPTESRGVRQRKLSDTIAARGDGFNGQLSQLETKRFENDE